MTLELALDCECFLRRLVYCEAIWLHLICPLREFSIALPQASEGEGLENRVARAI